MIWLRGDSADGFREVAPGDFRAPEAFGINYRPQLKDHCDVIKFISKTNLCYRNLLDISPREFLVLNTM